MANHQVATSKYVVPSEAPCVSVVRRPCQPTGLRVSQQEGASQPTNQGGAIQTTRSRVKQPGRESDNQVTSQPTRSRVSQPGRESANQVASQPTGQELANRSRVSQPVGSQPTGHQSANRSRVSQQAAKRSRVRQPGRESANQFARRT